jgi:hypothetical protein
MPHIISQFSCDYGAKKGAAAIHCVFPESALLKRLKVFQTVEEVAFFTKWPVARKIKDLAAEP